MGEPVVLLTYVLVFGTIGAYTAWLIRRDGGRR